jgi:penicillin-binding protein 1A
LSGASDRATDRPGRAPGASRLTEPPIPPDHHEPPRRRLAAALRRAAAATGRYLRVVFGRGTPWPRRTAYIAGGGAALLAFVLVLVLLYAVVLIPFTPPTSDIRKTKSERAAVVYSTDGERLVEFRPVNRQWVPLAEIAPEVRMALLATEDRRFYDHGGVDTRRLVGAVLRTLRGDRQGASTITQQLARNLYPEQIGRRITLTRKLKELITTIKIERVLTKDEILETYLNTVPFLYDAYGIELAARTYFGVRAAELDILQSATLVGMLKGTAFYNPVRQPERARERRNLVLRQMVVHGTLREDRYAAIADSPLALRFERQPRMRSEAPHFTEHVRRWVSAWARRNGYNMYRDSLVVHTTIDMRLQREAQRSVDQWLPALQAVADYEWSRSDVRLASRSAPAYRGLTSGTTRFAHLWSGRPELVSAFIRATPQYRRGLDAGHDPEALMDSLRSDQAFMTALREVKTRLETGLVALHPETGHVLAWVGSHDFTRCPSTTWPWRAASRAPPSSRSSTPRPSSAAGAGTTRSPTRRSRCSSPAGRSGGPPTSAARRAGT